MRLSVMHISVDGGFEERLHGTGRGFRPPVNQTAFPRFSWTALLIVVALNPATALSGEANAKGGQSANAATPDRSPVDLAVSADESWLVTANQTSDSISLVRDRIDFLSEGDRDWLLRKTAEKVYFFDV